MDALRQKDDAVLHAALDAVNTLMQPMHDQPDIRREQYNKRIIMRHKPLMNVFVDLFTIHAVSVCATREAGRGFVVPLPLWRGVDGHGDETSSPLIHSQQRGFR